jgi:hypothetical protein
MENLKFLIFSIILLGEIFFLIRKARFSPWLAPLAVILGNTLALYVFALVGLLELGFYVVLTASIVLGILSFFPIRGVTLKPWFSIPIIAFVILLLYSWVYSRGTLFYKWDEFSHWGVIYRYLMSMDKLPVIDPAGPKTVYFNYPPLTAIFQYFVAKTIGFKESSAYFAQMTLLFSTVIAIFPVKDWKDWKKYFLAFGVAIVSVIALDFVFLSLYVDLLMGLLFAAGLAQILLNERISFDRYILIILISTALVLTKSTGVFFAAIIIFGIIFAQLIPSFQETSPKRAFLPGLKSLLSFRVLLLLLIPFLAFFSWRVHSQGFSQNVTHFTITGNHSNLIEDTQGLIDQERQERVDQHLFFKPVDKKLSVSDVILSFTILAPYRSKLIISNFVSKLSTEKFIASNLSVVMIFVLIIISVLLKYLLYGKDQTSYRNAFILLNIYLMFGFCVYCLSLILVYIFAFPPYRATLLNSEYRYLAPYLLGWWLSLIGHIFQSAIDQTEKRRQNITSSFLIGIIVAGMLFIPLKNFISLPPDPDTGRLRANSIYKTISQIHFSSDDRIYDIFQEKTSDQGRNHLIMRYLFTPIATNTHGWELGTITSPQDYLTVPLTSQEWLKLLHDQGYTYVLVSSANDNFWENYKSLFDHFNRGEEGQLFMIKQDKLEKVELKDLK